MSEVTLLLGDCLEQMRNLPNNSIDAIIADPPYFRVKDEWWDRQWDTTDGFLAWLGQNLDEWRRVLKPNGSLYVFASPQMATRVEVEVSKRFEVLNSIRWLKPSGWHKRINPNTLRSFLSPWEAIIFAEQHGADTYARGESSYVPQDGEPLNFLFEPLRAYLASEWARAGLKPDDANAACGTVSMAGRHYFARSQWCLPTAQHYASLRAYANTHDHDGEYLRREYEDLRREYEELRRPFTVSAEVPYTDVWTFPTVQAYAGKHPCEKPLEMIEHIIKTSTRPNALVADPFAGGGTTGVACVRTGRNFIGVEIDPTYFAIAERRIAEAQAQLALPLAEAGT